MSIAGITTLPKRSDGAWAQLSRAVFSALLAHGTLTRAQIAELTGLSRVTASALVDDLIHSGYVTRATSPGVSSGGLGGPNARAYTLTHDSAYAVGVAINDYTIAVMTTSVNGAVVSRHDEPITDVERVVPAVARAIQAQFAKLGEPLSKLRYVVLGASGVVEPSGRELAYAVNRPSWKETIAKELRPIVRCPVTFENDANLAALAEARMGAGARFGDGVDLALVWLDEGVACGMIIGGRVYRGAAGWAGEIAFLRTPVNGGADREPRSDTPTSTTLQRAIGIRGATALAKSHDLDVDALLRLGSDAPAAEPAYAELARRIAFAVAGPVLTFDPDLVVLAGCVAATAGEPLVERVRTAFAGIAPAPVRLCLTSLESDAILSGAMLVSATYARDSLFDDTGKRP